jgi:hypothetical protein
LGERSGRKENEKSGCGGKKKKGRKEEGSTNVEDVVDDVISELGVDLLGSGLVRSRRGHVELPKSKAKRKRKRKR